MLNDIDKTEEKINNLFKKFDFPAKVLIITIFIISVFLNAFLFVKYAKTKIALNESIERYDTDMQRAKEQYSLLYAQNTSLNKQVKDLNLELIETINNTIELQRMFKQIFDETVTLYSIKDELNIGIEKTKKQLEKLQISIETIIENKTFTLDSTEISIKKEKSKM